MKALSVRQPWAWLIVNGFKDIENRTWHTNYRGRVLIHASKGMTRDEYEDALDMCHQVSLVKPFPEGTKMPSFKEIERGGIVGAVDIIDCVQDTSSPWFVGDYGFVLENAEAFEMKPCKGALGFFKPDYSSQYKEPEKKKTPAKKQSNQRNLFDE